MDAHRVTSRRSVIAGTISGISAAALGLISRAAAVEAAAGDPIRLGQTNGSGSDTTTIQSKSTGYSGSLKVIQKGAGPAILGKSTAMSGVYNSAGVLGESVIPGGSGVEGRGDRGVLGAANRAGGAGGWFTNSGNGIGLYATGYGSTRDNATLTVYNFNSGNSTGAMSAYIKNSSNFATAHFYNSGNGQVLWLQNGGSDAAGTGGGDFITAVNKPQNDAQFRVLSSGEVRSDVGFNTPAADFAEMLPAAPGLEPGDVLVIGPDGRLARSSEPHQESVAGVFSTAPGFVGGSPVDGPSPDGVPLAMVGIVPVKASTENGAIAPGDLLTSSSTPAHAMRANGAARLGCVIGKALESLDAGTGRIRMLVILQ